jgi:HTH-type transcriptional regulator, competence development regulator
LSTKADTSKFGPTVRKMRKSKGIGLRQMACLIGASQGYLSQVERGNYAPPSEEKIVALADALETDAARLLALGGRLPSDVNVALLDHVMTHGSNPTQAIRVSKSDTVEETLPNYLDEWLNAWRAAPRKGSIRTQDFYLASYLVAKGYEPLNVGKDSKGNFFEFAGGEKQGALVNAFYARSKESAVPPLIFMEGMKTIQARSRELEDDDDSK